MGSVSSSYRISDLPPRVAVKVRVDLLTGCWLWIKPSPNGYGYIWWEGKPWPVYRLTYTLLRGEIPPGLEIDHVWARGCRWLSCCNPAHLEAVTHRENGRRMKPCRFIAGFPCGHPFTASNMTASRLALGQHNCASCAADRTARWRVTTGCS